MEEPTTELATSSNETALSAVQEAIRKAQPLAKSDDTFDELAQSGDYLPRLQLCSSNSKLTKRKKVDCGNYAYIVSDENYKDLGTSVDILPILWRPKALDMSDDKPISVFNEKDPVFIDIAARSGSQDSGCCYGPEFLVWIPAIGKFCGLFMGSKTARQESPKLREWLKQNLPCTLTSTLIEGKKHSWEAIVVNPCTIPIKLPTAEQIGMAVEKFNAEALAAPKVEEAADTSKRSR